MGVFRGFPDSNLLNESDPVVKAQNQCKFQNSKPPLVFLWFTPLVKTLASPVGLTLIVIIQLKINSVGTYRPSHLRRAFLACLNGPSRWGLFRPKVARLAAKQRTGVVPFGRYITTHMARLHIAARTIFGPPGIFK